MTFLLTLEHRYILAAAALIELAAAGVVALHAAWALLVLVRGRWRAFLHRRAPGTPFADLFRARTLITSGVLAALGFSVAATLLKTLALQDWNGIRTFAFILAFRTLLKRVFQWEKRVALRREQALGVHLT